MDVLRNLEENVVYEALVVTYDDENVNIKPFGVRFEDNLFILNLFPNRTLLNIKNSGKLRICFSDDALLFTKALFSSLDEDELYSGVSYEIFCEVVGIESQFFEDVYGKNVNTKIIAKATKIIRHNETLPTINRATNHIIELLIDFSRYVFMDVDSRKELIKKVRRCELIIEKTGNQKHKKAIKIIKKEVNEE